jgi:predicted membrane channel-forming protein YqfA (hemolysin III family)
MFLVPTTILFAALSAGITHQLKTLLSAVGFLTSLVWLVQIYIWNGLAGSAKFSGYSLSIIFLIAWGIALVAHACWWVWPKEKDLPKWLKWLRRFDISN